MTHDQEPPLTVGPWEYLAPLLGSISLMLSCTIVSSKRHFWPDELLSYFLLADPSFLHMIAALADTINNAPPLYFSLGWIWAKLFSASELSLRVFSSLGMCAALVITWLNLRRTYHFWPVTIATLPVFCLSTILLQKNAEARFYGLFLAVCALGLFDYGTLSTTPTRARGFSPATAVIHALMVYTHPFAFLYSGVILLALIIQDRRLGVARPFVYLSILTGWLSFLPWLPAFLNQAALGTPRSWISPPNMGDLIDALTLPRAFFLMLLPPLSMLMLWRSDGHRTSPGIRRTDNSPVEVSLLVVAYGFLGVPLMTWLLSVSVQPVFVDRYLLPTLLGWCILLAALLARLPLPAGLLTETFQTRLRARPDLRALILMVLVTTMLLLPLTYARHLPRNTLSPLDGTGQAGAGLPIAFEFSHPFMQRFDYAPERDRYFFILDWEVAVDPKSGLLPPGEYKIMDALRRHYPAVFRDHVVEGDEFLRNHRRFLVLHYTQLCTASSFVCPRWYAVRIEHNSKYSKSRLGSVDGMDLVLVEAVE